MAKSLINLPSVMSLEGPLVSEILQEAPRLVYRSHCSGFFEGRCEN